MHVFGLGETQEFIKAFLTPDTRLLVTAKRSANEMAAHMINPNKARLHLRRRPVTVQYPYEKLIPSERYRGRIHYEFDKCIACEVCVRVCPINLPVVDWVMNKATKKKELRNYSIDFGVCIFCGNCVEYCPTNCLSMTEEYELAAFDRHSLNYDNIALGRLPTSVTSDPAVVPLRELAYLPKGQTYMGPKPVGSWLVDAIECWGWETIRIPLGHMRVDQPSGAKSEKAPRKYPALET